ncbi:MAG: DUF4349 domain-containing protein [Clostridia bacterium]
MKRVKMIGFILLVAMVFVMVVGCAADKSGNPATSDVGSRDYNGQPGVDKAPIQEDDTKPVSVTRKIIKNGDMVIESEDVNATYETILTFAKKQGGYEFTRESVKSGDYTTINAVIKIKPELLDQLMGVAGQGAEVIESNISSDDITAKYTDIKIRLKTQEEGLKKYYEFLNQATNVSQILEIQKSITQITEKIESMKGQIRMWDTLVGEATLTLTLQQKNDPIKITKDVQWNALTPGDMWKMISNGFIAIVNTIVSVLQWVIIALAALSPLIVIAGIVLFILLLNKKKKKKNAAE